MCVVYMGVVLDMSVVDMVVSGGHGGMWWTWLCVVDMVVCGGQGGMVMEMDVLNTWM